MMMRSMTDPIFREDVSGKTLDVKAYDEPLEFSAKTGPERAALQRRSEINQELGARFQPAESLPNGTAWRNAAGYNVLQKGKRGKFRAYAPTGKLIGIYDKLETAQKAAIRLQEKDTAGKARFMPAERGTVRGMFKVQHRVVEESGRFAWEDAPWNIDDVPQRFKTRKEAETEIREFIEDTKEAGMDDYDPADYRVIAEEEMSGNF
jgi:hypothetical protein